MGKKQWIPSFALPAVVVLGVMGCARQQDSAGIASPEHAETTRGCAAIAAPKCPAPRREWDVVARAMELDDHARDSLERAYERNGASALPVFVHLGGRKIPESTLDWLASHGEADWGQDDACILGKAVAGAGPATLRLADLALEERIGCRSYQALAETLSFGEELDADAGFELLPLLEDAAALDSSLVEELPDLAEEISGSGKDWGYADAVSVAVRLLAAADRSPDTAVPALRVVRAAAQWLSGDDLLAVPSLLAAVASFSEETEIEEARQDSLELLERLVVLDGFNAQVATALQRHPERTSEFSRILGSGSQEAKALALAFLEGHHGEELDRRMGVLLAALGNPDSHAVAQVGPGLAWVDSVPHSVQGEAMLLLEAMLAKLPSGRLDLMSLHVHWVSQPSVQ